MQATLRHIYFKLPFESNNPQMFGKTVFLKISKTSHENTCTRVSFLIKLQAPGLQFCQKKRLWHRCCLVNYVKFPRKRILKNSCERLLLVATLWIQKHLVNCYLWTLPWASLPEFLGILKFSQIALQSKQENVTIDAWQIFGI